MIQVSVSRSTPKVTAEMMHKEPKDSPHDSVAYNDYRLPAAGLTVIPNSRTSPYGYKL
jgi:hypothetical protein